MDFVEYKSKYGAEETKRTFKCSDHLVLTVRKGRVVYGQCGNCVASEPLGNQLRNPDVETAIKRLREYFNGIAKTEQILTEEIIEGSE